MVYVPSCRRYNLEIQQQCFGNVTTTHFNNTILSLSARLLNSVTLVLKAAVLLEGFIHQKPLSRVLRQRDQENIVGVTPMSIPKCVRSHVTVHREPSFWSVIQKMWGNLHVLQISFVPFSTTRALTFKVLLANGAASQNGSGQSPEIHSDPGITTHDSSFCPTNTSHTYTDLTETLLHLKCSQPFSPSHTQTHTVHLSAGCPVL